jgi:hypothetical protein
MAPSCRKAQGLIVVSLVAVIGVTAWYGRFALEDSGAFAVVLFGIPLACAAFALWAEHVIKTMLAPAVVAALGVVSLAWSLLTALGIGGAFLLPSLLLLLAATVSWIHRLGRDSFTSLRT